MTTASDALLPQQFPVIQILLCAGSVGERLLDVRLIDVAHRYALRTELLKILAQIPADARQFQ